jgi:4-amino-4-deoxy-L-arabinose transferase-like glycosyltransferase
MTDNESRWWRRGGPWLLAGLVLLALALRTWTVGDRPLHPDELHYAFDIVHGAETATWSAVRDMQCAMQAERRIGHPGLDMVLARWLWFVPCQRWTHWSAGFLRGFHVLLGAATVLAAWGIGRIAGDARRALVLAGLVALQPALVWISRTMYLDTTLGLMIAVMLLGMAGLHRRGGGAGWAAVAGAGFGLALATKLSAPILAPVFLVGLAVLGPGESRRRERVVRVAVGFSVALLVFVLLVDPVAYAHAITHPSDPRYADEWSRGGVRGYMGLLFISLRDYAATAVWDGTPTLVGWALVAGVLAARRRDLLEAYWLAVLVSLAPLLLMHHPRLSGPHGFVPLWLMLAVIASGAIPSDGRWRGALIGGHALVAAGALLAATRGAFPFLAPWHPASQPNSVHGLVRPYLADRLTQPTVLLDLPPEWRGPATDSIRQAQLAEGAIILMPASAAAPDPGSWEWADVVVAEAPRPPEPHFEEAGRRGSLVLFRRTAGEPREKADAAELVPSGEGRWLLPGAVSVVGGRLLRDGRGLPFAQDAPDAEWSVHGRRHGLDWGTGEILGPGPAGGGAFTLQPPIHTDVDWRM